MRTPAIMKGLRRRTKRTTIPSPTPTRTEVKEYRDEIRVALLVDSLSETTRTVSVGQKGSDSVQGRKIEEPTEIISLKVPAAVEQASDAETAENGAVVEEL